MPPGEKAVALAGLTIGPARVHRPKPLVNHTTAAAAANTITPTTAADYHRPAALVFRCGLEPRRRVGRGRSMLRSRIGREDADLVSVEGVAVPHSADLDLVAVCKLTLARVGREARPEQKQAGCRRADRA